MYPPQSYFGPARASSVLQVNRSYRHDEKEQAIPVHHFFDPAVASERKEFIKSVLSGSLITFAAVLALLSIYWGSLWRTASGVHHLEGLVIDYDQKTIGTAVRQAFIQATGSPRQVAWTVRNSYTAGLEDPEELILNEKYWVVIVVAPGVTAKLEAAISSADWTYNGTSAVTAYYSQARSETTTSSYLLPQINDAMKSAQKFFMTNHIRSLSTLASNKLVQLCRYAPQVVYEPVGLELRNLRPFDVPVATAANLLGLIYLTIFAFVFTTINYQAQRQSGLYHKLSLPALLMLRALAPILIYLWLSLAYCLVSLTFQVPFSRFIPGGFLIYWAMSFLAMSSMGLVLESVITILGMRFTPYFLILWVLSNVSVSSYPIPMLPTIYQYGYVFPFYHVNRTVRAVIFGTKNEISINFLVQIAWIVFALIGMVVFQVMERRGNTEKINQKMDASLK